MDKLRLASPEEIASLPSGTELTPQSTVVAFENSQTGKPDFAILRQVLEIDPVIYAEGTTTRRKVVFAWALENALRLQGGVQTYYFNIHADADSKEWLQTLENGGAEKVSTAPEWRMRKSL